MNGSQAIAGTGTYDSGDVCAPEANGFIYVKSACSNTTVVEVTVSYSITVAIRPDCPQLVCCDCMYSSLLTGLCEVFRSTFTVVYCWSSIHPVLQMPTSSYDGPPCISIGGRHIGGVGIALIVAAIAVVVLLSALLCYCCCCRW